MNTLIQSLLRPGSYPHACGAIEVVETHLSWVLLGGPYAYKVKKPVDLGFADFSTLARRGRFCREELRLNRRLAPQLYQRVVVITGTPEAPRVDGRGRTIEYAVRMHRFPQDALAAQLLAERKLDAAHFEVLARDIAAFHERSACAGANSPRGEPDALLPAVRDNFVQLAALPGAAARDLEELQRWSDTRFAALAPVLHARKQQGRVRECHGDLHLGNLALLDGRLTAFDCIEFDPALRWIDTASEIAFIVMDLHHRGAPALAHRFLDAWLEASGDYGALQVLDFFLVYRALVRAKVAALRAAQHPPQHAARGEALAEAGRYVRLARAFTQPRRPLLLVMHGLSGSGKSTVSRGLVEQLGLIRVRSDVERKRLSGLGPDPYAPHETERTYATLQDLAAGIVRAGFGVVVDATFLRRSQRDAFARLARELGVRFRVIACRAPDGILQERIARRRGDVSEATIDVLAQQRRDCEPPAGVEAARTVFIDTHAANVLRRALRSLTHVNAPGPRSRSLNPCQPETAT